MKPIQRGSLHSSCSLFRFVACALVVLIGPAMSLWPAAETGIGEAEAQAIGDCFLKARNEANLALLDRIYDPKVVVHDPGSPQPISGLEALKAQYAATHAAVRDLRFTMDEFYVRGDRIAWVFTMTGTITAPFRTPMGELPATGRRILLSGVAVDRVVGGKIVEEWLYYNMLDVLQPLGFTLTPPQPSQKGVQ